MIEGGYKLLGSIAPYVGISLYMAHHDSTWLRPYKAMTLCLSDPRLSKHSFLTKLNTLDILNWKNIIRHDNMNTSQGL